MLLLSASTAVWLSGCTLSKDRRQMILDWLKAVWEATLFYLILIKTFLTKLFAEPRSYVALPLAASSRDLKQLALNSAALVVEFCGRGWNHEGLDSRCRWNQRSSIQYKYLIQVSILVLRFCWNYVGFELRTWRGVVWLPMWALELRTSAR